ncbi:MAG: hypothetical protein EXS37_13935 [Opitutus sp.]|nr:hypothetical protein [Opitutus sp.]
MNTRLGAAQADLEKMRAENTRLAEAAQAGQRDRVALEQRIAAAEAAVRTQPAPTVAAPESAALRAQIEQLTRDKADAQRRADDLAVQLKAARETPVSSAATNTAAVAAAGAPNDASLQQLAVSDSRIAKLIGDNARLNEDVKRSTIELAQLSRQLPGRSATAGLPGCRGCGCGQSYGTHAATRGVARGIRETFRRESSADLRRWECG